MNGSEKAILFRWEKWRIGYNLILLAEGSWLLRKHVVAAFTGHLHIIVLFAVAANVCYFLGPLLEICASGVLGSRANRTHYKPFLAGLRYFLFWVGLAFSMSWVLVLSLRGSG